MIGECRVCERTNVQVRTMTNDSHKPPSQRRTWLVCVDEPSCFKAWKIVDDQRMRDKRMRDRRRLIG